MITPTEEAALLEALAERELRLAAALRNGTKLDHELHAMRLAIARLRAELKS